tara:strand:+ start:469 stop:1326 length:858 start_codon:yes stop_codon:yes gene_type:complete
MHLGFIGIGSMGLPMAINLLNSGHSLNFLNRSRNLDLHKIFKRAFSCSSPSLTAISVDVLLICVTDDKAVEQVLFGPEGCFDSLRPGAFVLDFSTISYKSAISFSRRLQKRNIKYFDCPVTGGTEGASNGTLTILVGGKEEELNPVSQILKVLSSNIFYFDDIGSGQKVKAVNQILVAGTYAAVAEAITVAEKQCLPLERVITSLSCGAGSSWALRHRSKNMLNNNYPLGFKLSLHYKDMKIAKDCASSCGLELPVSNLVMKLEEILISQGYSDEDVSVLKRFYS